MKRKLLSALLGACMALLLTVGTVVAADCNEPYCGVYPICTTPHDFSPYDEVPE